MVSRDGVGKGLSWLGLYATTAVAAATATAFVADFAKA